MNRYKFPGFPIFLKTAADELDSPESERPLHRMTTLTAMANLCAQASMADPKDAPSIIAKAREFREQLRVAHRAAELMLEAVEKAGQPIDDPAGQTPSPLPTPSIGARNHQTAARNSSDHREFHPRRN